VLPLKRFIVIGVSAAILYVIILGGIGNGNLLIAVPTYEDDYRTLAYNLSNIPFIPVRPLAFYLSFLMGTAGARFCFFGAHVLAVVSLSLFFTFTANYLRIHKLQPTVVLCALVAALSLEHLVDYGRYLAVLFSLFASILSAGALLIFTNSFRTYGRRAFILMAVGVALCMTALLCKEEFVAPTVLFCFLCGLPRIGEPNRKIAWIAGGLITLLSASWLLYQKVVLHSPFLGGNSIYAANLSPASIVTTYWNYLTNSPGTQIAFGCQLAALALSALVFSTPMLCRLIVLALVTLTIMAPFSILPQHFLVFYTFDWTPLQCSTLLALCNLKDRQSCGIARPWMTRRVAAVLRVAMLAVIPIMISNTEGLRTAKFAWHDRRAQFNANILHWLGAHRQLLNRYEEIAVEGARIGSPWFANDGAYLSNKLGLTSKWLVLASPASALYQAQSQCASLTCGTIKFTAGNRNKCPENIPRLVIDEKGMIHFRDRAT